MGLLRSGRGFAGPRNPNTCRARRPAGLNWSCVKPASPLGCCESHANEGQAMRDIRKDLQDRASLLEEQINAAEAQFEKLVEQLSTEHESETRGPQGRVRGREPAARGRAAPARRHPRPPRRRRRRASPSQLPIAATSRSAQHVAHAAQRRHRMSSASASRARRRLNPQLPLADFLVRKLNEAGAMSRDDLRRLAVQEGYFVDADSAERGVHAALISVNQGRPHPPIAERQLRAGHRDGHDQAAPRDLASVRLRGQRRRRCTTLTPPAVRATVRRRPCGPSPRRSARAPCGRGTASSGTGGPMRI